MKSQSPFIDAFKQAVHPDYRPPTLTPGQGNDSVPPMTISADEIRKLANSFACSPKTLRRLLHRGIDITSPSAVACALAGQRNISTGMAEAVLAQLKTTESDDH
jgi:hypothetical protein